MELDTALKNFASAFAAGPDNIGIVHWHAPEPFTEPFSLGPIVKAYYAQMQMDDSPIIAGALQLQLWDLDMLETVQHGWRWVRDKGGPVTESPHWNKDRVIIANRNGDAVSVDDSTPGGAVHGHIGSYTCKIADDLAGFFETMAEAMLVEVNKYCYEVDDDDFNPLPAFLDDMRAIARRILGPDGETGFMKFFFD